MIHSKQLFVLLLLVSSICQAQNTLKTQIVGTGEPLVLIHGFASSPEIFDDVLPALAEKYECHLITLPGFDGSVPTQRPWLQSTTRLITEYLDQKQHHSMTIIGHSVGGTIALDLAANTDLPIRKLVLIDALPATGALMMPGTPPEAITYDNPYSKQLLEMDSLRFRESTTNMARGMTQEPLAREKVIADMLQSDRETYVYGYVDILRLDLREDLARIEIPVHLLVATQPYGRETVEQTIQNQFAKLEDYEVSYALNASHFVMYDAPEWFRKQLFDSLTD